MRRTVVAVLLAVLLGWTLSEQVAPGRAAGVDAARARLSYEAMQRSLYDRRTGGYRERRGAPVGARAWPFSQALAATLALARLPETRRVATSAARRRLDRLERRFRSGDLYAAWPGGDVYLDDNEWLAEDLLAWDALTGDARARERAALVFRAAQRAWGGRSRPCPGGVRWTFAATNRDRNTVSTANAAVVGLRLYALTRRPAYLRWSKRMLGWLDRCLLADDGLYADHIRGDGSVDRTEWSYNQGSVVAADVLLFETTGDRSALARAETLADATLARFAPRWRHGEPPEFAAVFFRRLLELAAGDGREDYVAAAQSYADATWRRRDPRTGLAGSRLLDQAALVQVYAALAAL